MGTSKNRPGQQLAEALDKARRAAPQLPKTLQGGVRSDGTAWFYADPESVADAVKDLLNDHQLNIEFWDQDITSSGHVQATFRIVHLPSMEFRLVRWTAPPNSSDVLGVSFTVQVAERNVRMHALGIEAQDDPVARAEAARRATDAKTLRDHQADRPQISTRTQSGVIAAAPHRAQAIQRATRAGDRGPPGDLITRFHGDEDRTMAENALKTWSQGREVYEWRDGQRFLRRPPASVAGLAVELRVSKDRQEVYLIRCPADSGLGRGGGLEDPGLLGGEDVNVD